MKNIEINNIKYEIVRNDNNCLLKETLEDKITDYYYPFDYIVGDFAYDKVRLKGFYDKSNKKCKEINNIENVDKYIKNFCSCGSKIFIIKKQ